MRLDKRLALPYAWPPPEGTPEADVLGAAIGNLGALMSYASDLIERLEDIVEAAEQGRSVDTEGPSSRSSGDS